MTNLAPETPPGRGISSRLLTMKFMQRAAASSGSPSEQSPEEPSSKRRKFQNSPLSGDFHSFDQAAVQAALKQQEAKRLAALEAHRAQSADTHWVLDGPWGKSDNDAEEAPPKIVYVGYAEIDEAIEGDQSASKKQRSGRKKIGNSKHQNQKKTGSEDPFKADSDSIGSSDSGESSEEDSAADDDDEDGDDGDYNEANENDNDDTPTSKSTPRRIKGLSSGGHGRTRVNLQSKKSAESLKAREFRDKRKKKEVKLNKLTSISGSGTFSSPGGASGAGKPSGSFNCYNCGKTGHMSADCPQPRNDGKRKSFQKSR